MSERSNKMKLTAKEKKMRKATYNALLEAISKKGLEQQFYLDQIELYMQYYDDILQIKHKIESKNAEFDTDLIKEKRLITKEMRAILIFLQLKPGAESGDLLDEEL